MTPKDSESGNRLPNGQWTGMIGQIVRGVSKVFNTIYFSVFRILNARNI